MCWADLGPTRIWYFSSGPDPAQKAGLGQDPPGPATKTGGGNYFPPTPACKTLFVLHAEKEKINTRGKKSYLARGRRWLAAFLAVLRRRPVAEAGGGVLAHGRRLQAEALLSQAAERGILPLSFSSVSSPLLLLLHFLFLLLCFFLILSPASSFSFLSSWVS
jgi:hypothetical protein